MSSTREPVDKICVGNNQITPRAAEASDGTEQSTRGVNAEVASDHSVDGSLGQDTDHTSSVGSEQSSESTWSVIGAPT